MTYKQYSILGETVSGAENHRRKAPATFVVNLGDPDMAEPGSLVRLLSILLRSSKTMEEKLKILEDEFGLQTTSSIRTEVESMSTWFQEATQEAGRKLAEEVLAPQMAREMAPQIAREMAPQIAREMAPQIAREMAPQIAREMAPQIAREMAAPMAREMAQEMLADSNQAAVQDALIALVRNGSLKAADAAEALKMDVAQVDALVRGS
ncbi:MAG: hypothetical protein HDQ87_00495 [Clostridia bacterium]|nr:hypothetical protein [Clostridia bacterium]